MLYLHREPREAAGRISQQNIQAVRGPQIGHRERERIATPIARHFATAIRLVPDLGLDAPEASNNSAILPKLGVFIRRAATVRLPQGRTFPAGGFACREFDDLGRNLLLPDAPLFACSEDELALGLGVCSRHGFHARFVLGGEAVKCGMAQLGVQVVRGQRLHQDRRCKVEQGRNRIDRGRKGGRV